MSLVLLYSLSQNSHCTRGLNQTPTFDLQFSSLLLNLSLGLSSSSHLPQYNIFLKDPSGASSSFLFSCRNTIEVGPLDDSICPDGNLFDNRKIPSSTLCRSSLRGVGVRLWDKYRPTVACGLALMTPRMFGIGVHRWFPAIAFHPTKTSGLAMIPHIS